MANKLSKFQQAQLDAEATIKALDAEAKKRRQAALEVKRKVQEQKWQALGEIVEQAGLADWPADILLAALRQVARTQRPESDEDADLAAQVARMERGIAALETDEAPQEPGSSGRGMKEPWGGR